jgi:hypothetical protein
MTNLVYQLDDVQMRAAVECVGIIGGFLLALIVAVRLRL